MEINIEIEINSHLAPAVKPSSFVGGLCVSIVNSLPVLTYRADARMDR